LKNAIPFLHKRGAKGENFIVSDPTRFWKFSASHGFRNYAKELFFGRKEVTVNPIKSTRWFVLVRTSTGRLFCVDISEKGNGIPTISAGWMIIPNLIFLVVPHIIHGKHLSFFQLL
jgi:hypothetical protein